MVVTPLWPLRTAPVGEHCVTVVAGTAATPASKVEAVVRYPTNMAAADIAAVDFNKMMSK